MLLAKIRLAPDEQIHALTRLLHAIIGKTWHGYVPTWHLLAPFDSVSRFTHLGQLAEDGYDLTTLPSQTRQWKRVWAKSTFRWHPDGRDYIAPGKSVLVERVLNRPRKRPNERVWITEDYSIRRPEDQSLLVAERRLMVYSPFDSHVQSVSSSENPLPVPDVRWSLEKGVDRFQLFQYSALTLNPHRIHLDPSYARKEGHADVIIHAPLLSKLLLSMHLHQSSDTRVKQWEFRVHHSIPAGEPLNLCMSLTYSNVTRLWIEHQGHVAVEGQLQTD